MQLQTYYASYVDRNSEPLFVEVIHADGADEATEIAFANCPPDAEFDILEPGSRGTPEVQPFATSTAARYRHLLNKKASAPNMSPMWIVKTRKRQRAQRTYAEKAMAMVPPKLVYGCFSWGDQDYELYRIADRVTFVATAELTLDEIMVLAMENLGAMKGDYLAGLDPASGKVVTKLMLK